MRNRRFEMTQGSPQRSRRRRQLRLAQRYLAYARDRQLHPRCLPVNTFWVDARPNFGDDMVPRILAAQGIAAESASPADVELAAIGSILEMLPRSFSGYVWGSGQMMDAPIEPFTGTPTFLAVRGHLTRAHLGLDATTPVGDPGLLAGDVIAAQHRPTEGVAIVPHYHHIGSAWHRRLLAEGSGQRPTRWIDVRRTPEEVVREIGRSAAVVTTSLHGLIVADALGVPVVWGAPAPDIGGGDFKFRDHESVFGEPGSRRASIDVTPLPQLLRMAERVDAGRVEDLKAGLTTALRTFIDARAEQRISPLRLPLQRVLARRRL